MKISIGNEDVYSLSLLESSWPEPTNTCVLSFVSSAFFFFTLLWCTCNGECKSRCDLVIYGKGIDNSIILQGISHPKGHQCRVWQVTGSTNSARPQQQGNPSCFIINSEQAMLVQIGSHTHTHTLKTIIGQWIWWNPYNCLFSSTYHKIIISTSITNLSSIFVIGLYVS